MPPPLSRGMPAATLRLLVFDMGICSLLGFSFIRRAIVIADGYV
jgi:hypothetical protein